MDGMLSQDEINALLSGMDPDGNIASSTSSTDQLSQSTIDDTLLTASEKDAIGEVANISMGTSATTLYSLVNRKVIITTPVVTLANWDTVIEHYEKPCVFIQIRYRQGLEGTNILVLKEHDVKVITDLMMGGDGTNTEGELGELHLSAISEAMNQMMGSAATSLSSMLGATIDITPPEASLIDLHEFQSAGQIAPFLEHTFVKIAFNMQIYDLVDSTLMQLYPIDFAKSLYTTFMEKQQESTLTANKEPETKQESPVPDMSSAYPTDYSQNLNQGMNPMNMNPMNMNPMGMNQMNMGQMGMNQMNMGQMGMNQMNMGQMGMNQMNMPNQNYNVQQAQFQNFSNDLAAITSQENINLIKDVPLEVTVELGRTSKSISDILDFAPGTIIELDKIAGEPVDVLVNGKFVAKGEVVVIEESFSVRITEIIK